MDAPRRYRSLVNALANHETARRALDRSLSDLGAAGNEKALAYRVAAALATLDELGHQIQAAVNEARNAVTAPDHDE